MIDQEPDESDPRDPRAVFRRWRAVLGAQQPEGAEPHDDPLDDTPPF